MKKSVICLITLVFIVNAGLLCAEPAAEPNVAAFMALEEKFLPPEPNLPPLPPADRMEAARKLADAMDMETALQKQAELAYNTLMAPMSNYLERQMMDEDLDRVMKPFFEEARQRLRNQVDWKMVLARTVEEYARTFTAAELNKLTAFYSSPLGKRLAAETPRIQQSGWPMIKAQLSMSYDSLGEDFGRRLSQGMQTVLLERRQKRGVVTGQKFPAFKGPCVDGSVFDSAVLTGKVTYMTSWAYQTDWVQNLPRLRVIYDLFHAKGLEIVGFSLNYIDEQEERKEFLKANPMPWPNLAVGYDDGLEVSELLVLDGPPVSFLVGRDGVLIAVDPKLDELPMLIENALKVPTGGRQPSNFLTVDPNNKNEQ